MIKNRAEWPIWPKWMGSVTFFNDGDSGDEFEGFRPGDLIDFNDGSNNISANLPVSDFSPDRDHDWMDT